jgi:hypothetical protein
MGSGTTLEELRVGIDHEVFGEGAPWSTRSTTVDKICGEVIWTLDVQDNVQACKPAADDGAAVADVGPGYIITEQQGLLLLNIEY